MPIVEPVALLEILTFVGGAVLVVSLGSFTSALLRPQPQRAHQAQRSTYESGEEALPHTWGKFNTRFYAMAIVFALFEVETVLLFPWATCWAHPALNEATEGLWAKYTALSGGFFILLLALGLAYIWRQGCLAPMDSTRPPASSVSKVPQRYYEAVNQRYAMSTQRLEATTPLDQQGN